MKKNSFQDTKHKETKNNDFWYTKISKVSPTVASAYYLIRVSRVAQSGGHRGRVQQMTWVKDLKLRGQENQASQSSQSRYQRRERCAQEEKFGHFSESTTRILSRVKLFQGHEKNHPKVFEGIVPGIRRRLKQCLFPTRQEKHMIQKTVSRLHRSVLIQQQ